MNKTEIPQGNQSRRLALQSNEINVRSNWHILKKPNGNEVVFKICGNIFTTERSRNESLGFSAAGRYQKLQISKVELEEAFQAFG